MDRIICRNPATITSLWSEGLIALPTNNSELPKHINQLIPYFANSIPGSNYYVEDDFNSYINKIRQRFSVFHLNIRSLNCHHKELIAYLHLLNLKFDCICLSEVWSSNLKSYQSAFQDYIPFFVEPIDNSRGSYVCENDYKVCEMNELKIPYSSKVRVEDL